LDALEIEMYLVGLDGKISKGGEGSCAWNAALITPESIADNKPKITDSLEILIYLAGMESRLDFWRNKP
jgi:hypothetical protein